MAHNNNIKIITSKGLEVNLLYFSIINRYNSIINNIIGLNDMIDLFSLDSDINNIAIAYKDNKWIGISVANVIEDKAEISHIEIIDEARGKSLCRPLLTFLYNNLKKNGVTKMTINNASIIGNGIPACICYVKAGKNAGFKVKYYNYENSGNMDNKDCILENGVLKKKYYKYILLNNS